jgi:hypothetical protein
MGERGSSIPTLCSFLSQGRLEVEEVKKREPFPSRRREMEKNKRPASLGKGLLLSLLSNKGSMLHQCSGSNQERERERWRVCMLNRCAALPCGGSQYYC